LIPTGTYRRSCPDLLERSPTNCRNATLRAGDPDHRPRERTELPVGVHGALCCMTERGARARQSGPLKPQPPDRRTRRTEGTDGVDLDRRAGVIFWLLLLFAPASSRLALGERIVVGTVATAVIVPMMWFRSRH
jgi:hypothetical protein